MAYALRGPADSPTEEEVIPWRLLRTFDVIRTFRLDVMA
jgi:hypothetical protein